MCVCVCENAIELAEKSFRRPLIPGRVHTVNVQQQLFRALPPGERVTCFNAGTKRAAKALFAFRSGGVEGLLVACDVLLALVE